MYFPAFSEFEDYELVIHDDAGNEHAIYMNISAEGEMSPGSPGNRRGHPDSWTPDDPGDACITRLRITKAVLQPGDIVLDVKGVTTDAVRWLIPSWVETMLFDSLRYEYDDSDYGGYDPDYAYDTRFDDGDYLSRRLSRL